jgi:hypothetical protein
MDTTTITTTTTTTTDTQIGMSSFVRFLFSTMIYSVFGFFFSCWLFRFNEEFIWVWN